MMCIRLFLFALLPVISIAATPHTARSYPAQFDLRDSFGSTPGIKQQGNCGSSWAVPIISFAEWSLLKQGNYVELSAQPLLDCAGNANPCGGGPMNDAFDYLKVSGAAAEADYPYTVSPEGDIWGTWNNNTCQTYDAVATGPAVSSPTFLPNATIPEVKEHLSAHQLPVPISMEIYNDFYDYSSGIYSHTSGAHVGSHGVLIVGYGSESTTEYWIVQNSWGPSWGESGYFRIQMIDWGGSNLLDWAILADDFTYVPEPSHGLLQLTALVMLALVSIRKRFKICTSSK